MTVERILLNNKGNGLWERKNERFKTKNKAAGASLDVPTAVLT